MTKCSKSRESGWRSQGILGASCKSYESEYKHLNGCCEICGIPQDVLMLDHDHATGGIRGLLCSKCNMALGLVGDSIQILRNMESYLFANR